MKKRVLYVAAIILIAMNSCVKTDDDTNIVIRYWDNGNAKEELHYKRDSLNGTCKWYFNNGNPMMEVNYEMNTLEGASYRWYENGNLMEKSSYKDGRYDGVIEEYNVSGVLIKRSTYKDGILDGPSCQWYDNGEPFVDGLYLNGMMHGSWIMYYPDGSIGSKSDFDRGTGVQRGFSQGGLYQNALIHYKDNLKDGREYRYGVDGSVEEILIWQKGEYMGNVLIDN